MRAFTAWVLLVLGLSAGCHRLQAGKDAAQKIPSHVEAGPAALTTSPADVTATSSVQSYARGIAVYREQFCGICHRFAMAATEGVFGPPHDGFAAVAAQRVRDSTYTGMAATAAEYIRESIVDPTAYLVAGYGSGRHHMPPYVDLPPDDLEALVRLLLAGDQPIESSLKPPDEAK